MGFQTKGVRNVVGRILWEYAGVVSTKSGEEERPPGRTVPPGENWEPVLVVVGMVLKQWSPGETWGGCGTSPAPGNGAGVSTNVVNPGSGSNVQRHQSVRVKCSEINKKSKCLWCSR